MTLPVCPKRTDGPVVFADRADTFLGALPQFEIDMNAAMAVSAQALLAAPAAIAAANYKGDYSAGTTYTVGQSVSSGGSVWYAKTTNTGVAPATGSNWQQMSATVANPTGNAGKVLGTLDGIVTVWIARLPTQTGMAGYVLTSNGTIESWVNLLMSTALLGVPTAPTAAAGTSTTQLATTAFATTAINGLADASMAYAIAF